MTQYDKFIVPRFVRLWVFPAYLMLLTGCGKVVSSTPFVPLQTASPSPTITSTLAPPTSTPVPLAAIVNGEPITLAQYQAELTRYKVAIGTELATEDKQRVLEDLIDQYLLAQAAKDKGFIVDNKIIQDHIASLGTPEVLANWISNNGYTEVTFRQDLRRSLATAWMRDQLIAQVPTTAEQVHVRQILLYSSDQANEVLAQLKAGKDFAALAAQYDPLTFGDLGWSPRHYLLDPKIEEAVFSLQPGQSSDVIQTSAGFHIIQVIERESQRPLDSNALLALQLQALDNWLQERRNQSQIQFLLP